MKPFRFRIALDVGPMPVFKRSKSAIGPGLALSGVIGGRYCTSGSRSLRSAFGTGSGTLSTVVYTAFSARASTGSRTKFANWASFAGSSMLNRSFEPVPVTSSLMSALPMRCTGWNPPELDSGSGDRRTVTRARDVWPYVPMTASGLWRAPLCRCGKQADRDFDRDAVYVEALHMIRGEILVSSFSCACVNRAGTPVPVSRKFNESNVAPRSM